MKLSVPSEAIRLIIKFSYEQSFPIFRRTPAELVWLVGKINFPSETQFVLSIAWIASQSPQEEIFKEISNNLVKVLSQIVRARQSRRTDGYIAANTTLTNDGAPLDDVFPQPSDDLENNKMALPPRYRFRDLLLGDFAFTDDGQRWVARCCVYYYSARFHIATSIIVCHSATCQMSNNVCLMKSASLLILPSSPDGLLPSVELRLNVPRATLDTKLSKFLADNYSVHDWKVKRPDLSHITWRCAPHSNQFLATPGVGFHLCVRLCGLITSDR